MKYLKVRHVLQSHERVIAQSGGDPGVRDLGLLESAVADKAAALAFSLVMNHPFADGNKRTGYVAMMLFLSRNGHTIDASIDDRESVFLRLAASEMDREEFVAWVRDRIVRK